MDRYDDLLKLTDPSSLMKMIMTSAPFAVEYSKYSVESKCVVLSTVTSLISCVPVEYNTKPL